MKSREREALLEETVTAWRPRSPDGRILAHPAWADLPESERQRAFDETLRSRSLESLLHPRALSTTAQRVLARLGFPTGGGSL